MRQTFHNQYLHSQVCFYDSYITHSSDHVHIQEYYFHNLHIASAGYVRTSKEQRKDGEETCSNVNID